MASRLYSTTRQLFVRASATLSQLGLSAMLSPTVFALQALRRHPEETLGAVKERLQLEVVRGNMALPAPVRAKAALL